MRRVLPVLALAALVAGCSSQPAPSPAPVTVTTSASPVDAAKYGTAERTPRGSIPKDLGQHGAVTDQPGAIVLDFVIDKISEAKCDQPGSSKPENGRFVAVHFTATTKSDPNRVLDSMTFGAWEFVAADGRSISASTPATYTCHYDAPRLGPNRSYDFTVVVDIPSGQAGALVFNPFNDGGWEWQIAA